MTPARQRGLALGLALTGVLAAGAGLALWPRATTPAGPRRPRLHGGVVRTAAGDTLAITVRALPRDVEVGGEVVVAADILRGRGRPGALTLSWRSSVGRFADPAASTTTWRAPAQPGDYTIGVLARDDAGEERGSVRISVVLPRGGDLLTALRSALVSDAPMAAADFGAEERRLRELGATRGTLQDRQRAQIALEQLAQLLMDGHRYEEAMAVYRELTQYMLPTDPLWKRLRQRMGTTAFYLGLEDEAIAALRDAGSYASGMPGYYLGEMLARRGQIDDAIAAFQLATLGEQRYADPVLRLAQLELDRGRADAAVAALVEHSAHLGRQRLLERLERDPALGALAEALEQSGRTDELVEASTAPVAPTTPQVVGDGPASVREVAGP